MQFKFLIIISAATGLLFACSSGEESDGPSPERQAYVDAFVAGLENESSDSGQTLSKAENTCIAEGLVDVVGVDALKEAGLTPENIADNTNTELPAVSDEQREQLRELLFDSGCVDMAKAIAGSFQGSLGVGATDDQINCLAETLMENEEMQGFMVDGLLGQENEASAAALSGILMSTAAECGIGN